MINMASTKVIVPPELILQIFLHLPTKSLKRLSCVLDDYPDFAKELQSSSFRHKHALRMMSDHTNEHLMVPSKRGDDNNIYAFDPSNALLAGGIKPRYDLKQLFKDILPYETETLMGYNVVGGCNGLVCLFFEFYTLPRPEAVTGSGFLRVAALDLFRKSTYHFILWNPCTGENHALPTPGDFRFKLTSYDSVRLTFCGFGYDVVNGTYKVVLGEGALTKSYDLSTNLWEVTNSGNWSLDVDFYMHLFYPSTLAQFGTYLDGNLYWIVLNTVIVSIDLSTGLSTRLNLPECCSSDHQHLTDFILMSMDVLKGCLTVACFRERVKEVGIWVLEGNGGGREALWTNKFTVELISSPTSSRYLRPLWMSQDEETMLFLSDENLVCWNPKLKEFTYVENLDITYTNRGILHIDTLVSPKPVPS